MEKRTYETGKILKTRNSICNILYKKKQETRTTFLSHSRLRLDGGGRLVGQCAGVLYSYINITENMLTLLTKPPEQPNTTTTAPPPIKLHTSYTFILDPNIFLLFFIFHNLHFKRT